MNKNFKGQALIRYFFKKKKNIKPFVTFEFDDMTEISKFWKTNVKYSGKNPFCRQKRKKERNSHDDSKVNKIIIHLSTVMHLVWERPE